MQIKGPKPSKQMQHRPSLLAGARSVASPWALPAEEELTQRASACSAYRSGAWAGRRIARAAARQYTDPGAPQGERGAISISAHTFAGAQRISACCFSPLIACTLQNVVIKFANGYCSSAAETEYKVNNKPSE